MSLADVVKKIAVAHATADVASEAEGGHLAWTSKTHEEIIDTRVAVGLTTVWFVFECLVLYSVQSGSDSYAHYVYAAVATIRDGQPIETTIERRAARGMSEYDVEWAPANERYDTNAVFAATRDAWLAELAKAN